MGSQDLGNVLEGFHALATPLALILDADRPNFKVIHDSAPDHNAVTSPSVPLHNTCLIITFSSASTLLSACLLYR